MSCCDRHFTGRNYRTRSRLFRTYRHPDESFQIQKTTTLLLAVLQIRDFHPGSWFLPIPDPGSKHMEKKNCYHTFLCSHKFRKIENYFSFEVIKKNFWANFQKIIDLFTQKMGSGSGIRDPGSGKNLFRIPDPGVKKAPDPGSGSATLASRLSATDLWGPRPRWTCAASLPRDPRPCCTRAAAPGSAPPRQCGTRHPKHRKKGPIIILYKH